MDGPFFSAKYEVSWEVSDHRAPLWGRWSLGESVLTGQVSPLWAEMAAAEIRGFEGHEISSSFEKCPLMTVSEPLARSFHAWSIFLFLHMPWNCWQPDSSWSCSYHLWTDGPPFLPTAPNTNCIHCLLATFLTASRTSISAYLKQGIACHTKPFIFWPRICCWQTQETVRYLLTSLSLLPVISNKHSL